MFSEFPGSRWRTKLGRRGPAPKPTALRVLEGNPSHRPLPKNEPKPMRAMPRRPALLTGEARLEWERQAPRLFRLGVLTEVDGSVLTLYCQNFKRWLQAEAAVEKTLEATGRLNRMRVLIAHRYGQAVLQLAGQLGLSPSARARMSTVDRDDVDDFAGILS